MSHAEYAPKQLPVLTRLAIALRRIPAVEFAFAKFKSLLRGRTNDESAVVSEFQAPAADAAKDDVARGAAEAETVEPDTVQAGPDGTETAAAELVATDTVEAEEIEAPATEAPATDVAETATAETGAAEIDADEPVTTSVCDNVSPAMASDDFPRREIETVEGDDLPVEVEIAEIESAQTPLVAIESAEADSAEAETIEPVALSTEDVTAHVAPSEDSSEAVVAETDVLPLDSAEADIVGVEAIETAPFEIKTESEAAQPDVIEPEAVEAAPSLVETFERGAADPDAAKTVAAISVETDVVQLDLVDTDSVEAAPVEAVIAKADIVASAAVTKSDDLCDRETLIRRRWKETGIRMWRGTGQSVLCIQGRIALMPPKPGETMPGYDRLEFRLINGLIICEGFVVDPPEPPRTSQFT
ncbi:hypothetical protein NLM33_10465 [Bradyrhizobium sp. CCGUVB1N3]|uniref:hypothetical protein n=1 Tax=Bradyrhizobium sp. CCGUVB1N3 TaxID=2949629 RepID=UPI0020B1DA22|nr:hypothetical protein [Bradyrhizobium sp. CCGUVB1N3]MCP3470742.1 hypothetical protein [Bradyrhizobium sp. CCGUVB1N3]